MICPYNIYEYVLCWQLIYEAKPLLCWTSKVCNYQYVPISNPTRTANWTPAPEYKTHPERYWLGWHVLQDCSKKIPDMIQRNFQGSGIREWCWFSGAEPVVATLGEQFVGYPCIIRGLGSRNTSRLRTMLYCQRGWCQWALHVTEWCYHGGFPCNRGNVHCRFPWLHMPLSSIKGLNSAGKDNYLFNKLHTALLCATLNYTIGT